MGVLPIVLDGACRYMVDNESLTTDEWSLVQTLALVSGGVSAVQLLTGMGG